MNNNVTKIIDYLDKLYKEPVCELSYNNDYELLCAVMLSAQCTDKRVNTVTPKLFHKYCDVFSLAIASIEDVKKIIMPCGLYNNKAKNLLSMAQSVVKNFGGKIPSSVTELQSLAGVGRKTANVVTSVLYNNNVIAVDTHVLRISNRLCLIDTKDTNKATDELEKIFVQERYKRHYQMVLFGRYHCKAKNPCCDICGLKDICCFYKNK